MVKGSRPAELFYARLVHALQEAGVDVSLSRRAWPLPVLTKVLHQLMREVPKQLLARELWAGAGGAAGWWRRQRRHAASGAAASVVGYLLGVGDRHLDNILLDLHSAELVHIDFNVCFDKGARLRVPEVVPFRLTQTMQVGSREGRDGFTDLRPCCASEGAKGQEVARRHAACTGLPVLASLYWPPCTGVLVLGQMDAVSSRPNCCMSRTVCSVRWTERKCRLRCMTHVAQVRVHE